MTARCLATLARLVVLTGLGCLIGGVSCSSPDADEPAASAGNESETAGEQPEQGGGPDQVLRHAVFFKFKDTSSDAEVTEVVDAFRALPAKIPEIIDFQWGTNINADDHDELTHCFLLTFKDAAGREIYLPHDDHAAFGKVLGPHVDKVFVIDYWGNAKTADLEKELRHLVFFKFKDDAPAGNVRAVEEAFAALPTKIEAIKDFEWGRNNSPERHHHGFTHCFMVTFDSDEGRAEYLPHADHMAFVETLDSVVDDVRVLAFWAAE